MPFIRRDSRRSRQSTNRPGTRIRLGLTGRLAAAIGLGFGTLGAAAAVAIPTPAAAASVASINLAWSQALPDAGGPVVDSSPNVAQLPGGPAVVVGDTAGKIYAYNLASGTFDWLYNVGYPVDSTPSAAPTNGSPYDSVFVGDGDIQENLVGGYQAITPTGSDQWFTPEMNPPTDPTPSNGVQASLAVGDLQGSTDVVADTLGENEDALNASTGTLLAGFPWFQADSSLSTPAIADIYANDQNEIIEGGASTFGYAYGTQYQNGGHLRILSANGNAGQSEPNGGLDCEFDTNQEVDSSPAVGQFLSGNGVGIAFGTGFYYPGASETDQLLAVNNQCQLQWAATLDGLTTSSPALADVLGNGQLDVVEGTSSGTVWVLNGTNGATVWRASTTGSVTGSVVTADLTGEGYQDVLVPTTAGVDIFDGRTGDQVATLEAGMSFQNSPLVTADPNGTIGITIAGSSGGQSVIVHYEVSGSNGSTVNEPGAWPMFHHDPQLTGNAGTPAPTVEVPCNAPAGGPHGYDMTGSDGGIFNYGNLPFCGSTGSIVLNKPVVGIAVTRDGGGYWTVAADGGIFAFDDAHFYGSMGGLPLNQPIVGMAADQATGGYWLVAADGGIFAFNAPFHGSMGGTHLNQPIVGMAATPDGGGYWLVARDGGIFAFGDALFYGSMGGLPLNKPVVGMAADQATGGYWLVASDGGIFSFNAPFHGSMGGQPLNQPIVGMSSADGGSGYWEVAADGGIFSFNAPFYGSTGGKPLNKPIVGIGGA